MHGAAIINLKTWIMQTLNYQRFLEGLFQCTCAPLIIASLSCLITVEVLSQHPRYYADVVADPFGLGYEYNLSEAYYYHSFADIDGDGDLDLFVLKYRGHYFNFQREALYYHENIGDRVSAIYAEADTTAFGIPNSIEGKFVFVDIDDDDDLDLFATRESSWATGDIMFLENTGSEDLAVFGENEPVVNPFNLDASEAIRFNSVSFGDMDGDGDLDAFINGNTGDRFIYQENIGSAREPVFDTLQYDPFGLDVSHLYGASLGNIQPYDWDCDGDADLMISSVQDTNTYFRNLTLLENHGTPTHPKFEQSGIQPLADNISPLTYVDFDQDGDLDIYNHYGYYENVQGCGTIFESASETILGLDLFPAPENGHYDPALVDIDGDGDQDLFMSISTNHDIDPHLGYGANAKRLDYYENTGSSTMPHFVWIDSMPFRIPKFLFDSFHVVTFEFVDLDADGDFDLLGGYDWSQTPGILYLENKGTSKKADFGLSEPVVDPFGLDPERTFMFLVHPGSFADIDGDGDLDRLGGEEFQENIGTASQPLFSEPVEWQTETGRPFGNSKFVDWDCDGDFDIMGHSLRDGIRKIYLMKNEGTSTAPSFERYKFYDHSFLGGAYADLDDDGDPDVLQAGSYLDQGFNAEGFYYLNAGQESGCTTTSVKEMVGAHLVRKIIVFPNPASGTINVPLPSSIRQFTGRLEVVNYSGKMVHRIGEVILQSHETAQLDVSELSSGLYVIRLVGAGEVYVGQFVVVR